jgi:hypothetical protein
MARCNSLSRILITALPVILLYWPEQVLAQRTTLNWTIPYHGPDRKFISKFLHEHPILGEWMGNGILKFDQNISVVHVDLDDKGTKEMIVGAVHSSATCGGTAPDAGCQYYVFRNEFGKWEFMGDVEGIGISIYDKMSDGYRIIKGHYYRFRWNKKSKRFDSFCLDHVKTECEKPSEDENG